MRGVNGGGNGDTGPPSGCIPSIQYGSLKPIANANETNKEEEIKKEIKKKNIKSAIKMEMSAVNFGWSGLVVNIVSGRLSRSYSFSRSPLVERTERKMANKLAVIWQLYSSKIW